MRRGRPFGRFGWYFLLAVVIITAVAIVLVRLPGSPIRTALDARVADWLASEFGAQARIGQLRLGWRSLVMLDVVIPLDDRGSSLVVKSVGAELDWMRLIADPRTPQRVVRVFQLSNSVLTIAASGDSSRGDTESWIPRIVIPSNFYRGILPFEGLRFGGIDECTISILRSGSESHELCRFSGEVTPGETDGLRLVARGNYLGDTTCTLSLTGTVQPAAGYGEAQLLLDVPAGAIPGLDIGRSSITTEGGHIALRAETVDSLLIIKGSAALAGLGADFGSGILRIPDARLSLSSDSIIVPTLHMEHEWFQGDVAGVAVLRGGGLVELGGELRSRNLEDLAGSQAIKTNIRGAIAARFSMTGNLDDPLYKFSLSGENLEILGKPITDARAELTIRENRVELDQFTARVGVCRAEFSGLFEFNDTRKITGTGRLMFDSPPGVLGWESNLKEVCLDAEGTLRDPLLYGQLISTNNETLGELTVNKSDSGWQASGGTTTERSGILYAIPSAGGISIHGEDVQHWITMIVGDTQSLRSVETLGLRFHGSEQSGDLQVHMTVRPDSTEPWTYLARDFQFTGQYEQAAGERTSFSGQWTGIAGGGLPFEGRGSVTLEKRRLLVNQFFVDNVGEVRGWIDLGRHELDIDLVINGLALKKLLGEYSWFERMKLQGNVSGYLQAQGSLDKPRWTTSVAMTNGSVLGVGGYWINLESDGIGRQTNIRNFELGRDVRRISSATGESDFDEDSIAIRFVIEDADASDLFLALTGRQNIFTGNLNAWAMISGQISRPNIEARMTIDHGELFGELYADVCTAALQTEITPDGRRVYRIPDCFFQKDGAYRFAASGEIDAESGQLDASIEGNGDFLDLIDQVDRTFRTKGSLCSLRTTIGGTLKHPELLGAALTVTDGRFSYTDACPSEVDIEASLCVAAGGFVEPGFLRFRVGDRQLEIALAPAEQSVHTGLESLVIPVPHVNLGVIEVRTSATGMPLRLPGLMKADWSGIFSFGLSDGMPVTISSAGEGRLLIEGQTGVRSARLTFPFVGGSGSPRPVAEWLMEQLKQATWNLSVAVESGNHYSVEITGLKDSDMLAPLRGEPIFETLAEYIDHLSIDAIIDPTDEPIRLSGMIDDETFRLSGRFTSTRGTADYLDQTFRVDRVTADFDETNALPILEGRGVTQGIDSLGRPVQVYLTMYQVDRETDTRQTRGRLDQVTFVLESDVTETPEQTLALLGYDQTDVGGKAEQVVTSAVTRVIGRHWLDPLERRLERWTLFDEIALSPVGGRGTPITRQQREKAIADTLQQSSVVKFFSGSQVTVGKYLTPDLFLTYTGELAEGQVDVGARIGFVHLWNVEYRMNPLSRDLVLDFAVEYDEIERQRDESISLKYSFALEP